MFGGFQFFEGYYHTTTKQQSERLYLICSIFIGVKKPKKAWHYLSHLSFSPKFLYICLFFQCTREFLRLYIDSCLWHYWRLPNFEEYFPINLFINHNDWTEKMEIYEFEYIRTEASFMNNKNIFHIFEWGSILVVLIVYGNKFHKYCTFVKILLLERLNKFLLVINLTGNVVFWILWISESWKKLLPLNIMRASSIILW